ncbi:MAG: hypothetical protein K6V97_01595 [Actinomycetia bacterium]|nr:hypothetical protein [Actinomycetes bacterium]
MDSEAAVARLSDTTRPVPARWWLAGPDTWQAERVLAALAARLGPEVERRRVDGAQDPAELAWWLRAVGFFDAPKLLVWREPDAKAFKHPAWPELVRSSHADAVFVAWTDKAADPPNPAADWVRIDLEWLKPGPWAELVRRRARGAGVRLSREELDQIAAWTHPSGHYLDNLLAQCALLPPEAGRSRLAALAALGARPLGAGAWYRLADAVAVRDGRQGLAELERQLAFGGEPVVALVVMARQMLLVADWIRARRAGQARDAFARAHGVRPWQWRTLDRAAELWTPDEVAAWLGLAIRADRALKGSEGDPSVWLAMLVLAAHRPGTARPPGMRRAI